jgi:hypothetical protein
MKTTDKIALIDKVGRELQSRYGYSEIDLFLSDFGISPPTGSVGYNSKWVYSKAALRGVDDATLARIAAELDLAAPSLGILANPPVNWKDTKLFRLFLSHISKDKFVATRLKECLAPYAISGFVAHEDIHPTLEWQDEIEKGLRSMDAFVAIHTTGFSASIWTQQEVGFALGRGTRIISFKMGEDPTGFISRKQALARRARSAELIAKEIDVLLAADPRTSERLASAKAWLEAAKVDEVPF